MPMDGRAYQKNTDALVSCEIQAYASHLISFFAEQCSVYEQLLFIGINLLKIEIELIANTKESFDQKVKSIQ